VRTSRGTEYQYDATSGSNSTNPNEKKSECEPVTDTSVRDTEVHATPVREEFNDMFNLKFNLEAIKVVALHQLGHWEAARDVLDDCEGILSTDMRTLKEQDAYWTNVELLKNVINDCQRELDGKNDNGNALKVKRGSVDTRTA